jgi:Phosphotransferase enzyme family
MIHSEELRILGSARTKASPPEAGDRLPPPDVVELARRACAAPGGRPRFIADEPLKKSVHRLRFEAQGGPVSVVVKRLPFRIARANQLVAERWLPAAGLEWACPALRGVVHEPAGSEVWHIYEDLGGGGLDGRPPVPERVVPVVELIVDLHTSFADHALLPECQEFGAELGMRFFTVEVARSVSLLESIGSPDPPPREQLELRDRLLGRVERLHCERHERALLLETFGGPDTLLHGDLWPTNTLVVEGGDGLQARLVDWDHVGVGPVAYDLSTFLYRFPSEYRPWILRNYREAAALRGWRLPDDSTLNLLFETAEYARYACCLAEAAHAASRGEPWGFEQLAEIDTWFASLAPALAVDKDG